MKHNEHLIQKSIIEYLRMNRIEVFAVPNGGRRDAVTGAMLKAEGATAGVSDLIILLPNKPVFVEVKTKTGRQSDNQKDFQNRVEKLGFEYYIWRSVEDAVKWNNERGD